MEEPEENGAPPSASKQAAIGVDIGALVTREALYDEVWAEPMTAVAARYVASGEFPPSVVRAAQMSRDTDWHLRRTALVGDDTGLSGRE